MMTDFFSTTAIALALYQRHVENVYRPPVPKLIASEITGVCPMVGPTELTYEQTVELMASRHLRRNKTSIFSPRERYEETRPQ